MEELVDNNNSSKHHAAATAAQQWPRAPDLQLDCLSESDDTDEESDDSIQVLASKLPAAATAALDCKPGPSQAKLAALVASKCAAQLPAATKDRHLVIDLTNSDDEGNQRAAADVPPASDAPINNERLPTASGGNTTTASSNSNTINRAHIHGPAAASLFNPPHMPSRSACLHDPRPPATGGIWPHGHRPPTAHQPPSCRFGQNAPPNVVAPPPEPNNNAHSNNEPTACPAFANCFVGNPASGGASATAPTNGPCPHAHGYCPVASPHQVFFPAGPQPQPLSGFAIGPMLSSASLTIAPGHAIYPHHVYQPPQAHSHTHSFNYPLDPRIHPSQHQLWVQQQRQQEAQRRRMYPHQRHVIR